MLVEITPVTTQEGEDAALSVRREVFCFEMGIPMAKLKLPSSPNTLQLVAWEKSSGRPVATLTLLETSGNLAVHQRYGLAFSRDSRSVRYAQLGILKPFRGLRLSLRLVLEGYRLFVEPAGFDYSWLVFDAERASSSSLVQLLKFTPDAMTVASELGRGRVLTRDEQAPESKKAMRLAEASLRNFEAAAISSSNDRQTRLAGP